MFKRILALLFIGSVAYAAPLESAKYFNNSKGLLDHTNPFIVDDQHCLQIDNVSLHVRGLLEKRAGQTQLNTVALSTSPVTGGHYHNADSGNSFFAVVVGSQVYRTGNTFSGTYTDVTNSIPITALGSNLAQATALNDYTIFCNEVDKPFKIGATGNAVQLSTPLFSGAKTCTTYGNYLVLGNVTESSTLYGSRVIWSDINTPDSFPALNYIDVEPNDGDRIVSLATFDDSVYVFKKRSIYRMYLTGLDGPDAFIIRPVARNIGAWAKNSVKVIPNVGIVFLAQSTVYVLSDNGLEPIGDAIQGTFNDLTRSMWGNAVGEVYPKTFQYWLAVSTSSDSRNHTVLVYDYTQKAWAHYILDANMLAQAENSTGDNILVSGDFTGNHYQQDSTQDYDTVARASSNITFQYTTPDYHLGAPEYTKNYKYLYLFFDVVSSSITVEAAFDYATTYEQAQVVGLTSIGALYDTAVYDTDIYPGSASAIARIELNRSAKAVRLRFTENSSAAFSLKGWSIVYSREDWRE